MTGLLGHVGLENLDPRSRMHAFVYNGNTNSNNQAAKVWRIGHSIYEGEKCL